MASAIIGFVTVYWPNSIFFHGRAAKQNPISQTCSVMEQEVIQLLTPKTSRRPS